MVKKFTLDAVKSWARENPVLVVVSVALLVLSSLVSLVNGGAELVKFYKATLGKQEVGYKKIEALSTQVSIDYFSSLLGAPVFKNRESKYVENIFVDPQFYVLAVADENGKVLLYSVTTRVADFHPKLDLGKMSLGGRRFVVTLGETTFSKIEGQPDKIDGWLSNRRMSYSERYYFGNPGLYQNYHFSLCDSGFMPTDVPVVGNVKYRGGFDLAGDEPKREPKQGELAGNLNRFRSVAPVNTFSVSEPFSEVDDKIDICPDLDQVRLLHE